MLAFHLAMDHTALDAWGNPEDIGATTVAGPIAVSGKILFGSLGNPVSGGLYAATQGQYRVTYPFDEHATLLEGELALTDEDRGVTEIYGPGDSWIIAKGTTVLWDIRSAAIRKSYLAVSLPA